MTWLDLTHPLRTGMHVYPGDPPVTVRPCRTHARDGYQVARLGLSTHSGTHLDAPLHVLPGGAGLDQYPVDRFHGTGVIVDARGLAPGAPIGTSILAPVRALLAGADFVVFCTGWDQYYGTPEYERHPHLSAELARDLAGRGVRLVGVDTLSPDPVGGTGYPAHEILLGAGVLICENLTGLAPLAGGAAEFWFLPLKIAESDGAPVRALGRPLTDPSLAP